jgi:hypothetical protein
LKSLFYQIYLELEAEPSKEDNTPELCISQYMGLNSLPKNSETPCPCNHPTSPSAGMILMPLSPSSTPWVAKRVDLLYFAPAIHLARKVLSSSPIWNEALTHGCSTEKVKPSSTNQSSDNKTRKEDDHGDILIKGFWAHGTKNHVSDLASVLK